MKMTIRSVRTFAAVSTLAVAATVALAHTSGATVSPNPAIGVQSSGAHGQRPVPPRFLPVIGPNGKPVVDEHGTQLIMDSAPETGDANPNGKTVIATKPGLEVERATRNADNVSPTPVIVRPYDDKKYHEK